MHDKTDKIIYVGKAISLKRRVTQYFRKNKKLKEYKTWSHLLTILNILYVIMRQRL